MTTSRNAHTVEVGALDLLDLQLLNERSGRDSLPYPFMSTRPTRFEFLDEVTRYSAQLPERLRSGDLSVFARCLDAWQHADVTVTGHVQYVPAATPSIRVLAFQAGQSGYLLEQRADEDVLDVSTVAPSEVGAAVATAMRLEQPGRHPLVRNAEYVPTRSEAVDEDDDVVVRHGVSVERGVKVSISELSAYAQVQSNWRPSREWGVDSRKEALIWVRIKDDGDYLGAPDRSSGIPLTASLLREQIEEMIAADIEWLRRSSE